MAQRIKKILRQVKKVPVLARIDWKLYLLRDWWSTRVWTRVQQVRTPFGFTLATKSHPAYELMRNGQFEVDETRIIREVLDDADVFIDVGANVGYYCCLALQLGKHVLAFEPQLQNLSCLYQNLTANGWENQAEVYPIALGAAPGLLPLYGASGPSASLVRDWAGYSSRYLQTVPVNTLDNIVSARFPGKRLIIKIDVEGAEFEVLRGALGVVSQSMKPIWLIEICFTEFHPDGANKHYLETFQFFWDHGYSCYGADEQCTPVSRSDVLRWIDEGDRDLKTFNYLFIDANATPPTPLG